MYKVVSTYEPKKFKWFQKVGLAALCLVLLFGCSKKQGPVGCAPTPDDDDNKPITTAEYFWDSVELHTSTRVPVEVSIELATSAPVEIEEMDVAVKVMPGTTVVSSVGSDFCDQMAVPFTNFESNIYSAHLEQKACGFNGKFLRTVLTFERAGIYHLYLVYGEIVTPAAIVVPALPVPTLVVHVTD